MEKNEIVEEVEELEEGGCGTHAANRDDDKKKSSCENCDDGSCPKCKDKKGKVKEEKGQKCCPKGTPGCPGPGKPGKPAPHNKLLENEELEEAEMTAKQKKFAALAPPEDEITYADKIAGATKNESKIQTPEQEEVLYESRFGKRNEEIFNKLTKLWTK